MSAFLSANRQPDREKTILAKVGFDAKKVSMSVLAKWIFISNNRHLHQFLGDLLLNAVQYAAKCTAFWC